MTYREIKPGIVLSDYVKCFYIYESDQDAAFRDTVFPSGCIEIIFNLGSGKWQTAAGDGFSNNPAIELWGQIIRPLAIRSLGRNTMLGIRFFPHGAACFLGDQLDVFSDRVVDLADLAGRSVQALHARLVDTASWEKRIGLLEEFLRARFLDPGRRLDKLAVVSDVMKEMRSADFFDNIDKVASRYGISSRYLQKLFLTYTGLTPKLFTKINRFQRSLRLVTKKDMSLTSIAYDCGYFDQSHFIREFKSFTGVTPSGYAQDGSAITFAFANC
jgi:AraC-like DNA-binding protein